VSLPHVSADAEGDAPPLDAARIIQVLAEHHVDYLLIGDLAARYHGAERGTKDIDILTRGGPDNLDRLAAALRGLGAYLRVGGVDDETARALPVVVDAETLTHLDTSTWRTDAGDIDALVTIRDSIGARLTIADIEERAVEIEVLGIARPSRQPSRHHRVEDVRPTESRTARRCPSSSDCRTNLGSRRLPRMSDNDVDEVRRRIADLGSLDRLSGARRGRAHSGPRRTRSPRCRRGGLQVSPCR
jgi:hypothetical protein